jgi:hypothetical protein
LYIPVVDNPGGRIIGIAIINKKAEGLIDPPCPENLFKIKF